MQYSQIPYLLNRYIVGQMTEQEGKEWSDLLRDPSNEAYIQEAIRDFLERSAGLPQDQPAVAPQRMLEAILSVDKTVGESIAPRRSVLLVPVLWKWAAAAVLLAAMAATGYVFLFKRSQPVIAALQSPSAPRNTIIAPGSNKAILTLASGAQVELTDVQNGVLSHQGNTKVIKLDSGKLSYDLDRSIADSRGSALSMFNTITTPRGGQYQITLPDGSMVWLNAASSLRFPTAFTGNERKVELTGEGYFEVAKDADRPFIVASGQTETIVLGTHFDIMAYDDENAVRTTLLEGSVKMNKGFQSALLTPGEQGAFDKGKKVIATRNVNVKAVVAWKNGYYFFDRTPVENVMRQIARWYDVDIVYQGRVPEDEIVGKIPRSANVSEVLHVMELIGIHFKIDGRKIIVIS
jgi:transmembrane sensor